MATQRNGILPPLTSLSSRVNLPRLVIYSQVILTQMGPIK